MKDYGDPAYWEQTYESDKERTYDWLISFESLMPKIEQYLKSEYKILVTGCGNAEFSEKLYDAGYKHIWNNDISKAVITQMKERNNSRPEMHWEVMDVCEMNYENGFFDIVIDKSTIDAICCGESAFSNVAKITNGVSRVLKEGGKLVIISYAKPYMRFPHLKKAHLDFDVEVETIKGESASHKTSENFIYIATKGAKWQKNSNENFSKVLDDLIAKESEEK